MHLKTRVPELISRQYLNLVPRFIRPQDVGLVHSNTIEFPLTAHGRSIIEKPKDIASVISLSLQLFLPSCYRSYKPLPPIARLVYHVPFTMPLWYHNRQRSKYSPLQQDNVDAHEQGYDVNSRRRSSKTSRTALWLMLVAGISLLGLSVVGLRKGLQMQVDTKAWTLKHTSSSSSTQSGDQWFERESSPLLRSDWNASALLKAQYKAIDYFRRPSTQCEITSWHDARYDSLRANSFSPSILLALNLRNSDSIIANMLLQLPELLRFLGPSNVYVFIYESGSDDAYTQNLLWFCKFVALYPSPPVSGLRGRSYLQWQMFSTPSGRLTKSSHEERLRNSTSSLITG